MNYKTKQLLEGNYDFNQVYPEKQAQLKVDLGYDMALIDVVDLLRRETSEFRISNPVALDLDNAIYETVIRYHASKGEAVGIEISENKVKREVEVTPAKNDADEWKEAIETLKMLIDIGGSNSDVAEWNEALETLEMLLN